MLMFVPIVHADPLDGLDWLAGTWSRQEGATFSQEVWTAPHEGVMLGTFRLQEGSEVKFLELSTITAVGDAAVLRMRHHDVLLQPWADESSAATFVATELGKDRAVFHSDTDKASQIEFVRKGKTELLIRLIWRDQSPPAEFPFIREK